MMGSPICVDEALLRRPVMLRYTIENMTCGHCVGTVTKAVRGVDVDAEVFADIAGKSLEITTVAQGDVVARAIGQAGYAVTPA
jgi:copper chaperone